MLSCMKHKLKLRLPGEISTTSDMQMITSLMAESEEERESLLKRVKEESEKPGLKLNIQKTKIMASGPIVQACLLSCFSRVQFFAILWTIAGQTPLSMGLSRQEYWSGLLCPPPGDLPNPWIEPRPLTSPALAVRFFTTNVTWEATSPITSWQKDGEKVGTVTDFIFLGSKITVDCDYSHKLKDACSLEEKLWQT